MAFVIDASIVAAWAFEETSDTGAPPVVHGTPNDPDCGPNQPQAEHSSAEISFPPWRPCISSVYYRHLAHVSSPCLKAGSAQRLAWLQEGSLTRPGTA